MNDIQAAPPLSGIRVLDVSSVLSGPMAAQLLADLGADVIKVENPLAPDFTRGTGNGRGGMTAYFYNVNRGKRSLAIDGRHPEGQTVLRQLADRADVLIQNMRPGKAAKVGLDPDECMARNPSLVYASISGYGSTGPSADEPVYDYVIQAVGGSVDLQRDPGTGRAELARHFPADKITSHACVEAVLAALFARERNADRRGQHVEISMHEANLAFFWPDGMMQHTLVGQPTEERFHPGEYYRVYPTSDGDIVLMPLMGPFAGICNAVGHPEWIDDQRWPDGLGGDMHLFQDLLSEAIAELSTDQALAAFAAQDVPAGAVVPLADVHAHPQAVARGSIVEHDAPHIGPVRIPRPPWQMAASPAVEHGDAPVLGEHTTEILGELGLDQGAIQALRLAGVVTG